MVNLSRILKLEESENLLTSPAVRCDFSVFYRNAWPVSMTTRTCWYINAV